MCRRRARESGSLCFLCAELGHDASLQAGDRAVDVHLGAIELQFYVPKRAMWAPSVIEKDGAYYMFFGANDIQNDNQVGGIGVARAQKPGGPFEDHLGRPLVDKFHNGAQPIDAYVFKDEDGMFYLIYGGWRHCNIAKLNADFTGFVPFPDGTTFKEITPSGYVEGSFMFVKDGKYYFMWSEGGWTGPNYAVAYAIGSSPLRIGGIGCLSAVAPWGRPARFPLSNFR